jgi:hypothetical protein
LGQERRSITLDGLTEQVECTVKSFREFRRDEFMPLRRDVEKLHTCVDEVLNIVKFLKTAFKVSVYVISAMASAMLFLHQMGVI